MSERKRGQNLSEKGSIMRLSWKLGRFAGIDVFIHATFLLVLLPGIFGELDSLPLILALFGCVLLHEYGHALTARRFGIDTLDITLYPIGGVARLKRLPRAPGAELVIALAGPAVNFVIVGLLWLFGLFSFKTFDLGFGEDSFFTELGLVNLGLGLFNLIPAFPMDGGRVLRAFLSMPFGRARATAFAAGLGRLLAVVFGLVGVFVTQSLLHIALAIFIFLASRAEESQVYFEERRRIFGGTFDPLTSAPAGYFWEDRGNGQWQLRPRSASASRPAGPGPWI